MCRGKRNNKSNVIASFFLIGLGVFFLLQNFSFIPEPGDLFFGGLFGMLGTGGFLYFFARQKHWWVLIPSSILLGLSGGILSETIGLFELSGTLFMFGLAMAFWVIFITQRKHWWAGIPAGVFTTLGFTALVDEFTYGDAEGSIFFLGLGLTFLMLWLLRRSHKTGWAIFPAIPLLVLGIVSQFGEAFIGFMVPLLLMGIGGFILLKALRSGRTDNAQPTSASHQNGHYQNGATQTEPPLAEEFV